LGIELIEIVSRHRGLRRYLELAPRTVRELAQRRPRIVIVQSPSIVLAGLVLLMRARFGYRVVIDAHNEAVEPFLNPSRPVVAATHWMLRSADRVIVTNEPLARVVEQHGGRPIVLPDPLPPPRPPAPAADDGTFHVTVIATYAGDEPIAEILTAARLLGGAFRFSLTGNPARLSESLRRSMPGNVTLTGFLPEEAYWRQLSSSHAVLDLTTMDNCLVCGAYEAIAAGVPSVLSDNAASIATFSDFAEFTANRSAEIAAALTRIRSRHADFTSTLSAARARFEARWANQARELLRFISDEAPTPP